MTALLIGLLCFAAHVGVTLVWLRLPGRMSPVARHAVSALATHILGLVIAVYLVEEFAYWPAAAVNAFGVVCCLFAFSAVYKSVSLRVLTELARAPGRSLAMETITAEHVQPEFEARISVLVKMGCAAETPEGFVATAKGKDAASRIQAVQGVCGINASGLYGAELAKPASD
jgi:hypothetical protein